MINKLGVQAYTFRQYYDGENASEATLDHAFRTVKALGYDEIQTAGFGKIGLEKYCELAHAAGLTIVGTHYDFREMVEDTDEAMRKHREILKTNLMGIGSMPPEARTDREELFRFIDRVNHIADKIKDYGFKFTYHNHHFEFVRIDGEKTVMDYLFEGLNPETVSFCLDTHWVQRGGGDPATWIGKLAGRIDILHLKDMKVVYKDGKIEPMITEIGAGNMDFDGIIDVSARTGVKYYCVEEDICPGDPLDSLKVSADYIKAKYMVK